MQYHVRWTIEIDAECPEDAARAALALHRDRTSGTTVFTVVDPRGVDIEIDLEPDPPPR